MFGLKWPGRAKSETIAQPASPTPAAPTPAAPTPAAPQPAPPRLNFEQLFTPVPRRGDTGRLRSYSQLGEDIYCFQNFMNIPRNDAVLFEVGAYDGTTYSNSFALERFHDCRCVLVEPSPVNVRKIHRDRPNASIYGLAILEDFGVCEFVGDAPVSGVLSQLSDDYVKTWKLDQTRRYNVLSAPLRAVTQAEKVAYIDFLSIDVQGAELAVLNSMDRSIPVGTICIELEGHHPADDEACRTLLREWGFVFKGALHISEFWYKPDYPRSGLLFDPDKKSYELNAFEHLYFTEEWRANLKRHFY